MTHAGAREPAKVRAVAAEHPAAARTLLDAVTSTRERQGFVPSSIERAEFEDAVQRLGADPNE